MLKLDLWKLLLLDLKSIASDILQYIFEPAEWIRYIAIYFNLPSEYDTWPADKPPIYLQKSFISSGLLSNMFETNRKEIYSRVYNREKVTSWQFPWKCLQSSNPAALL